MKNRSINSTPTLRDGYSSNSFLPALSGVILKISTVCLSSLILSNCAPDSRNDSGEHRTRLVKRHRPVGSYRPGAYYMKREHIPQTQDESGYGETFDGKPSNTSDDG